MIQQIDMALEEVKKEQVELEEKNKKLQANKKNLQRNNEALQRQVRETTGTFSWRVFLLEIFGRIWTTRSWI